MTQKTYQWESSVRDYELDVQGIVNNAIFINYFEQCRNDYARSLGIDFIEYHKAGYMLVVAGIEIQYRSPLMAEDKFYVTAAISGHDDKRVHFEQEIRLVANNKLVAKAMVHIACIELQTKKSCMPDMLKAKLSSLGTVTEI